MQAFLEKTAAHLHKKYGDKISELCIVLPNRRAGLFFKKYLSVEIKKTFWSPEIFSIEDFIRELSNCAEVNKVELLFKLYSSYTEEKKLDAESFDDFIKWAQILLNDFNEIDSYLADTKNLFTNLSSIKEIENWSLSEGNLTEFQQKYILFWDMLGTLYNNFTKKLRNEKKAYDGLASRIVCETLDSIQKELKWHKIIFIGFNALTKAEKKIISTLVQAEKAEIFWDADEYYLNNPLQEAGIFLRENSETGFLWKENILSSDSKTITVIGAAGNNAQAKAAGQIISDNCSENSRLEKTAVVLADENLLFPVLQSIPATIENINVTMGYPLKHNAVADLFNLIFNLHENRIRFGKGSFYHKDILRLLNNPGFAALAGGDLVSELRNFITKSNYVFISEKTVLKWAEENKIENFKTILPLLKIWGNVKDAVACLNFALRLLRENSITKENKSTLETEYIFAFSKILKQIESLIAENDFIKGIKTLHLLLKQLINTTTLPFYGEPLTGLQVMGVLETRVLDFENVIMLSVNEGVIPSARSAHSFIPFDLKKAFHLPVYHDRDAIFAYHFYRLLQRTKNIFLIYNTEHNELGSGEKSRFITQLEYELPKINKNFSITEKIISLPEISSEQIKISVKKTEEIISELQKKAVDGFSPTSLNTYKNCSLQFYFQYIEHLNETEVVEETIGADTFGNVLHKTMEELYKPFLSKKISMNDISEMKKKSELIVENKFREEFKTSELNSGKNLLSLKVAVRFVKNFLDKEIEFLSANTVEIIDLEKKLESEIKINEELKVKLMGTADRIDKVNGLTRIVDYKTGNVEQSSELSVKMISDIFSEPKFAKSFQLMMYALMLGEKEKIQSGIISFRKISSYVMPVRIGGETILNVGILKEFETHLSVLLNEIFNQEVEFTQTRDLERCTFCSFRSICNR